MSKENYEVTRGPEYWPIVAMEEAAEVIQAISKIMRFGNTEIRQDDLEDELKDLFYSLMMMEHHGYLKLPDGEESVRRAETKRGRNFTSVLRSAGDDQATNSRS